MDIVSLVTRARDDYVRQFREFAKNQRSKCRRGGPEIKMELDGGRGFFRGLCCVDFVMNDDETRIVELAPDEFSFDPVRSEHGSASLSVRHMQWDDILIRHDVDEIPQARLEDWFERWFDPDDLRYEETAELANNIHSLSVQPRLLSIDFGTAEPAALLDLLDLLRNAGASSINIGCSRKDDLN
jgi:hypothetical protein